MRSTSYEVFLSEGGSKKRCQLSTEKNPISNSPAVAPHASEMRPWETARNSDCPVSSFRDCGEFEEVGEHLSGSFRLLTWNRTGLED